MKQKAISKFLLITLVPLLAVGCSNEAATTEQQEVTTDATTGESEITSDAAIDATAETNPKFQTDV